MQPAHTVSRANIEHGQGREHESDLLVVQEGVERDEAAHWCEQRQQAQVNDSTVSPVGLILRFLSIEALA